MQNKKSIVNNHSMKVLNNTGETEESCNCRNKNNCPLYGKRLTPNIVLQSTDHVKPAQVATKLRQEITLRRL